MTFFIFSEIFFVTNLLTCVTNFVTCITNFVIYIQNFWIKNILADRKKYLGERKIFQGERKNSAADIFGSALVWDTEKGHRVCDALINYEMSDDKKFTAASGRLQVLVRLFGYRIRRDKADYRLFCKCTHLHHNSHYLLRDKYRQVCYLRYTM